MKISFSSALILIVALAWPKNLYSQSSDAFILKETRNAIDSCWDFMESQPDLALKWSKKVIQLAEENNLKKELASGYNALAFASAN